MYGVMMLVLLGYEKWLRGSNVLCMMLGEEWEDVDDEEMRRAFKACGLFVAKNVALMDKLKVGWLKFVCVGLWDYIV